MTECVRITRAEIHKYYRSKLLFLHIILPALAVLVFSVYYRTHDFSRYEEWAAYTEVLAVVLPAVVSIVCAMSVSIEEKNHFAVLLGIAEVKQNSLLAKWFALSLFEFLALVLAIGGFVVAGGRGCRDLQISLCVILILWLCSQSIYLFHLFMCLNFSGNAAMCFGALESLLAALMQTGLGDGIWQFFPCAFGGRWECLMLLSFMEGERFEIRGRALGYLAVNIGVSVTVGIMVILWFRFFEGRQKDD